MRINAKAIIEDAPRGLETPEIEQMIQGQDTNVSALMDETRELVALVIRDKSEAARARLREGEAELEAARERLRELRAQRDTLAKPNVARRLTAVQDALTRKKVNVSEANKVLRQAVRMIVMDPEAATLIIHWHHTKETSEPLRFPSRHFRWPGTSTGRNTPKRRR